MGGRGRSSGAHQWFKWDKNALPPKPTNNTNNANNTTDAGNGNYQEFNDTASGGWTYHGDGQTQVNFFNQYSNYDELIKNMDQDDRDAFRDYWTPGHFMRGQQYRGWDNMSDEDKRLTQIYDDILDKSTLSHGVVLTRRTDAQLVLGAGHYTATLEELRAAEGSIVTSKGSMSFGAAKEGLTIGDSSKRIEYRLSIPGGTRGAGMWIGDRRINGWGPDQREFMTNRDISIQVGATTYDAARDIYIVNIKYVGRNKHDYGKSGKRLYRRKKKFSIVNSPW